MKRSSVEFVHQNISFYLFQQNTHCDDWTGRVIYFYEGEP